MDKQKLAAENIGFRLVTENDLELLYRIYGSTRADEMAVTGWSEPDIENFLRMQFELQHTQYMKNYKNPCFEIILFKEEPVGRLYVERGKKEMRIIDIALLPHACRRGIGSKIISELIDEANKTRVILSLSVEYNNPVLGFYERLGFEQMDQGGVYLLMEKKPAIALAGKVRAGEIIDGISKEQGGGVYPVKT